MTSGLVTCARLAMNILNWTPDVFWQASPRDFLYALSNDLTANNNPLSRSDYLELKNKLGGAGS